MSDRVYHQAHDLAIAIGSLVEGYQDWSAPAEAASGGTRPAAPHTFGA